jgi:hypothetical protein
MKREKFRVNLNIWKNTLKIVAEVSNATIGMWSNYQLLDPILKAQPWAPQRSAK